MKIKRFIGTLCLWHNTSYDYLMECYGTTHGPVILNSYLKCGISAIHVLNPGPLATASAMAMTRGKVQANNFVLTFLKPRNIKA
jgi:hypothetical protein